MASASDVGADREIVHMRMFDAPRELVFKVWTDPKHVGQWWGPRGFSTTTQSMEVKPGGVWRYCMHGPDGRDYENRITYQEIVPPERLVYKHGGELDLEPVNFQTTVTFEDVGGKTKLTMRSIFSSAAVKRFVAETYGAVEGGKQHLDRLGEYLAEAQGATGVAELGVSKGDFVISRVFDAPRELVWRAWTEREGLNAWFGPKGVTISKSTLDLRVGGVFHYCMRTADGKDMWGKWIFREVTRPDRLVFVASFSDEAGGITTHPMAPDWPREMISTIIFAEHAGKGRGTVVTIRWNAINATEAEQRVFDGSHGSMQQGWTGTFEKLVAYLAGSKGGVA